MRVGVVYPQIELGGDPESLRRIGIATEQLGYDHLLMYDHVLGAQHADREPPLTGPYTEHDPFHDPLMAFAHLAALTARIELVTGVLILPQRQAALVARQCADLDLLSGGRLRLGLGTGWNYVEYDSLGTDFATRGVRFDEQVEVLRRLWTEPLVSFSGQHHRIERANILPRPNRPIPLWFGGWSEPAFRRAARVGDGFIYAGSMKRATAAKARVDELTATAGTAEGFGHELAVRADSPDDVAAAIEAWTEAGGTHASVVTMGLGLDSTEAHLDFIASVKQRLG
jgi:probable F420-dependent oxidoreductase